MSSNRIDQARRVIRMEADGLRELDAAFDSDPALPEAFERAVELILATRGHVIVVGVGKSGHIGLKIAASFASTGTPAFFMHPTEASHGDLGMVTPDCTLLAISNSGESRELLDVLRYCTKAGVPVIGLTREPDSRLGRASTAVLSLPHTPEACVNGLAPTTSTTNTLVMGDALVVAVMAERGLSRDDFGRRHPGGKLGRGLQTVGDWMAQDPDTPPRIHAGATIEDVVMAVTEGQHGCVAVTDEAGAFVGMITDGDLRRAMTPDMFTKRARDIMTTEPVTLSEDMLMSRVVNLLTQRNLGNAFVLRERKPVGVVNIKTLMRQGYV